MKLAILAAASAAVVLGAGQAAAQIDISLSPGFGSVSLNVGFLPDPYTVQINAGGSNPASSVGCVGYIASAPDFELFYNAGQSPLYIWFVSSSDTTLAINNPYGSWNCDDDSGGNLNPLVVYNPGLSGTYDIYVGTFSSGSYPSGTLYISEFAPGGGYTPPPVQPPIPPQPPIQPPAGGGGGPDWSLPANFGSISLVAGFSPDPISVSIYSGGGFEASRYTSSECRGWITAAPDYEVSYQAGSTLPLIFSVNSTSDTTLVINGPDGRWYCNDDYNGLNPAMWFQPAQSGNYDIWVGSYSQGGGASSTLYISELNAF